MEKNLSPRNRELVIIAGRISRQASAEKKALTLEQLSEEVRAARPLHFYYSYDTACRMMALIARTGIDKISAATDIRAGWKDLYEQVQEVRAARPKLSATQALMHTLMFRRPARVFLSANTIRKIIAPYFQPILTENGNSRA